jgi:ABC-type multidrug transport system fused ATPase/permease subunit
VLILLPPVTLIGKKVGQMVESINKKYLVKNDSQLSMISRILMTSTVIKAFFAGKMMEKDFKQISSDKYTLDKKQVEYSAVFAGLLDISMGIPFFILYIFSALLFEYRDITPGTLSLFLMLLNKITVPFVRLNGILVEYKKCKASIDRLSDILDVEGVEIQEANKKTIDRIESLAFKDVQFKYQDKAVLNELNFTMTPGKHYGIIGENGCGKTTFIKLLLNLYDYNSGEILINNVKVKDLAFSAIRSKRQMVYIEDKPCVLFDDFDKNILLGEEKDELRFKEILEFAGLYDHYDEYRGKSADELSAGQKQRVSIARAFYHLKAGSLLVMDEPFSALDANAVSHIHESLKLYKERLKLTIFEITHNLNGMERFDHICYFEDGKIIMEGTHQDLLNHEKYFNYIQKYKASLPVK